jgi:ABC-type phosphate/phosphonate transport system substrate-binding protein
VHPELDAGSKNRLRAAFLSLHKQPAAALILEKLHIERFEEGDDAAYNSVREMEAWMEDREKTETGLQAK